jgi:acetate---CoA ligase (ADP-forming)
MDAMTVSRPGAGLEAFFSANGIAIVGASDDITKIGGRPLHLLRKYGYAGALYPINPKANAIQGLTAYPSVRETPTAPEMAVLAVPATATLAALEDCAARGVKAVVVLSAGFAEAGEEGAALQQRLVSVARVHGMRLLGPNCLGTVSVPNATIGSFSIALEDHMPLAGRVGIVSQSGNIGSYTMQNVAQRGLGVSRFIATGNEADVDVADGIAALAQDDATDVILCCMETCRDGARLVEALDMARRCRKPVIMLKIGSTELGQAAAASHTGALAGSDAVIDAVFRRHGAVRVRSVEALLEVGHAASQLLPDRLPKRPEVTLVAASGGFGIMMADAMTEAGLSLPPLSPSTQARIQAVLPTAGTHNPVDTSAQVSSRPEILHGVMSALLEEPNEAPTVLFLSLSLYNQRLRGLYLQTLAQLRASHPRRLLFIVTRGPADAVAEIQGLGIPVFASIDAAADALSALVRLGQLTDAVALPRRSGEVAPVDRTVFRNEFHAKRALAAAGLPVPPEILVTSADEAVQAARATAYPVVMKVASEDIAHKTEVGGVVLGLTDDDAVAQAYQRIQDNVQRHAPQARIDGVLVAHMERGGVELIAGVSRDPVFGPVVMVGMGGIYAEVLKDVALQVAPVTLSEAENMIRSLRLFPLLDGARGQPRADVRAAAELVVSLSEFACRHAPDVAEIDLNPVLVRPVGQGVVVLDALMVPMPADTANDQGSHHDV